MTTSKKLLTADDLMAMPDDGKRHELVQGELITMPPSSDDHGFVGAEVSLQIGTFVRQRRLGTSRLADTGFQLAPDTVLAPDYAFISYERAPNRPQRRGWGQTIPDLVVEVVSPNDRQPAIDAKTRMWIAAGARLVLVVYPDAALVVAHHDDATVEQFGIDDTLTCEPVLPGFACSVADIFTY